MLYLLMLKLIAMNPGFSSLKAFTYLSSRAILALITSVFLSRLIYPKAIVILRSLKAGQPIRELGFEEQMKKKGTPTMGGVIIISTLLLSSLIWIDITNNNFITLLIITLGFGFVGFRDDYLKIAKSNPKGLAGRHKMLWLIFVVFLAIFWRAFHTNHFNVHQFMSSLPSTVYIPFLKQVSLNFGFLYIPFIIVVIIGSSNAVNLTDGLDGLAIGPVITCALTLMILSYVTGNYVIAKYLYYHFVPGTGEIAVFLAALIGSSIGFLWYNSYPAQIFMGDSGALALGGVLGTVAVITGHEFLLVLMGGVFVVEAMSVILQVASFRMVGKRIFKMAPLHHHYQKIGYPEQKIVIRVWIVSFIFALLSILTLKMR